MKFSDFQNIISHKRTDRYLLATSSNTRKAMTLYRYNLQLSQEIFTLVSCFEVALRNAIDKNLSKNLGINWLRDSILPGGIFDNRTCEGSAKIIRKAYNQLSRSHTYTHHKLLAEMEFGIWKYMFANPQFTATGQTLLQIFPNKPRSTPQQQYNQSFIFNELDGINILRNRIAHHEPICFMRHSSQIGTAYIKNAYTTIHRLFHWLDIDGNALMYGLDHVSNVCDKINQL
jgi:hypothetical protein